jgi:hypothetical protein
VSLDNNAHFIKVTGQFIHFAVTKLPFIDPNFKISPYYDIHDEYFDIGYFLKGDGRFNLLKLLLNIDAKGSVAK